MSLASLVISRIGRTYGVSTGLDSVIIFIFPLGTLTAENMSRSFKTKRRRKEIGNQSSFFPPGFAGNGLILLWMMMASILSMAFLSNIRAILMIPVYEPPIDSDEDIFKQGKTPLIFWPWRKDLLGSSNVWERHTGK